MISWFGTPVEYQGATDEQSAMAEIRIVWRLTDQFSHAVEPVKIGHWHPDSPGNRKMLAIIMASGNEIHGPNSHWIEERQRGKA